MQRWFTYDFNGNGIEFWDTETDAREAADSYMHEAVSDRGANCFSETEEEVVWGELVVKGRAKSINGKAIMAE